MGVMQVKPKPCPNCGSKYVEMLTKFFGRERF
nr:MAG TPA: restriction alleviation protein [Caudoviricetes sp.]